MVKNKTNSIHIKLRLSTGTPSSIKSILNKANVCGFLPEIIEINIIILLPTICGEAKHSQVTCCSLTSENTYMKNTFTS